MKKRNLSPVYITLIIGGFVCFLGWAALQAANSGPVVTDADYYSKGLRYTSTVLEKKAAEALGWDVSTQLKDRTLLFQLHGQDGQPVSSARGTLTLYLRNPAAKHEMPLEEIATGIYRLELSAELVGTLTAQLEFERDGARLNRQLLLNL